MCKWIDCCVVCLPFCRVCTYLVHIKSTANKSNEVRIYVWMTGCWSFSSTAEKVWTHFLLEQKHHCILIWNCHCHNISKRVSVQIDFAKKIFHEEKNTKCLSEYRLYLYYRKLNLRKTVDTGNDYFGQLHTFANQCIKNAISPPSPFLGWDSFHANIYYI